MISMDRNPRLPRVCCDDYVLRLNERSCQPTLERTNPLTDLSHASMMSLSVSVLERLLTPITTCSCRLTIKAIGVDELIAVHTRSVSAYRQAQKGRLNVTNFPDIASYLSKIDVYQQIGNGLLAGIRDPTRQLLIRFIIALAQLTPNVR